MGIFSTKLNYFKLIILIFVTCILSVWLLGKLSYHCPFRYLTTLNCAMCGSTRAIKLLLGFQFFDSFKMNPMALLWACILSLSYCKLFTETFYLNKMDSIFNINTYLKIPIIKYGLLGLMFINIIYLNLFKI